MRIAAHGRTTAAPLSASLYASQGAVSAAPDLSSRYPRDRRWSAANMQFAPSAVLPLADAVSSGGDACVHVQTCEPLW